MATRAQVASESFIDFTEFRWRSWKDRRVRAKMYQVQYGCFQKIGIPRNGWFIMENPNKMDDLGVALVLETCISIFMTFFSGCTLGAELFCFHVGHVVRQIQLQCFFFWGVGYCKFNYSSWKDLVYKCVLRTFAVINALARKKSTLSWDLMCCHLLTCIVIYISLVVWDVFQEFGK